MPPSSLPLLAGIEAGGTKFVILVGTGPDDIRAQTRIPTTTPAETLGRTLAFLQQAQTQHGPLAAIGIGSFGPLDPHPDSPTYGYITTTPNPGWAHTDFVGALRHPFPHIPISFDTDVNAAAWGEWRWGAAQGLDTFIYLTIGTGIGGGGMVRGRLMHGLIHPEMGHIPLARDPHQDPFPGICPFHRDCLEGLASGPAIESRWHQPAPTLPPDHPAWELEAHYLAQALHTFICTFSPQRIILGGGVMQQTHLFPRIRHRVQTSLNGYIQHPSILHHIDDYIVPPALGQQAGAFGALALAAEALGREPSS